MHTRKDESQFLGVSNFCHSVSQCRIQAQLRHGSVDGSQRKSRTTLDYDVLSSDGVKIMYFIYNGPGPGMYDTKFACW